MRHASDTAFPAVRRESTDMAAYRVLRVGPRGELWIVDPGAARQGMTDRDVASLAKRLRRALTARQRRLVCGRSW